MARSGAVTWRGFAAVLAVGCVTACGSASGGTPSLGATPVPRATMNVSSGDRLSASIACQSAKLGLTSVRNQYPMAQTEESISRAVRSFGEIDDPVAQGYATELSSANVTDDRATIRALNDALGGCIAAGIIKNL